MSAHEQRDVGSERGEDVNHLDAGHSGSDDDDPLGQLIEVIGLPRREDPFSVDVRPLRHARPRSGRDQCEVEFDGDVCIISDRHGSVRAREVGSSTDHLHPLGFEHRGHAERDPVSDPVHVRGQILHVQLDGTGLRYTEPTCVAYGSEPHRTGHHRLGRYAVPQVGSTADDLILDECHLRAERCGLSRGIVASGTAPDHEEPRRSTLIVQHTCSSVSEWDSCDPSIRTSDGSVRIRAEVPR